MRSRKPPRAADAAPIPYDLADPLPVDDAWVPTIEESPAENKRSKKGRKSAPEPEVLEEEAHDPIRACIYCGETDEAPTEFCAQHRFARVFVPSRSLREALSRVRDAVESLRSARKALSTAVQTAVAREDAELEEEPEVPTATNAAETEAPPCLVCLAREMQEPPDTKTKGKRSRKKESPQPKEQGVFAFAKEPENESKEQS